MQVIDDLQIMTGVDIPVASLKITLHQPRLWEIALIGEEDYFIALQMFCTSKKSMGIKDDRISEWQIFQTILEQKNVQNIPDMRVFLKNFLQLFVTDKVNFGPRSIMISSIKNGNAEVQNIEESNFDVFKEYIKKLGGAELLKSDGEVFKPANKLAARIAEKMKATRAKKAAMQAHKTNSKGFLKTYMQIIAVGLHLSLEQIKEMTLLQVSKMIEIYMHWEAYDLEVKGRLAGAKGDDKLIHWSQRENDPGIETV